MDGTDYGKEQFWRVISSTINQTDIRVELCIADADSEDETPRQLAGMAQVIPAWVKVAYCKDMSEAVPAAAALASAPLRMWLSMGAWLELGALGKLVRALDVMKADKAYGMVCVHLCAGGEAIVSNPVLEPLPPDCSATWGMLYREPSMNYGDEVWLDTITVNFLEAG